jgi:hypothetical protein
MTSVSQAHDVSADPDVEARRLTRWSMYMLPVTLVWTYLLGLVTWLLWIKIPDRAGESVALTDGGAVGWVAMILLNVLGVVPAVLGGWFAVRALRLGARWGARAGLALNSAAVMLSMVGWIASLVTQA